jgi:hypothetical protein
MIPGPARVRAPALLALLLAGATAHAQSADERLQDAALFRAALGEELHANAVLQAEGVLRPCRLRLHPGGLDVACSGQPARPFARTDPQPDAPLWALSAALLSTGALHDTLAITGQALTPALQTWDVLRRPGRDALVVRLGDDTLSVALDGRTSQPLQIRWEAPDGPWEATVLDGCPTQPQWFPGTVRISRHGVAVASWQITDVALRPGDLAPADAALSTLGAGAPPPGARRLPRLPL